MTEDLFSKGSNPKSKEAKLKATRAKTGKAVSKKKLESLYCFYVVQTGRPI